MTIIVQCIVQCIVRMSRLPRDCNIYTLSFPFVCFFTVFIHIHACLYMFMAVYQAAVIHCGSFCWKQVMHQPSVHSDFALHCTCTCLSLPIMCIICMTCVGALLVNSIG